MSQVSSFILCCSFIVMILMANAETMEVREGLVRFMVQLSPRNRPTYLRGWNLSSDPCLDPWTGVLCNSNMSVRGIFLNRFNFTGTLDAVSLCVTKTLAFLSLNNNYVVGILPGEISQCSSLRNLYLCGNSFSGSLPTSLSQLKRLRTVDISDNTFAGELPDMSGLSGLFVFAAQNNEIIGSIPNFNFSNLEVFNVSNNHLSGPIPYGASRFPASSFSGNQGLCGEPLSSSCAAPASAPGPNFASGQENEQRSFVKRLFGL